MKDTGRTLYTICALLTKKEIVQFLLLIARAVLIHHFYAGPLIFELVWLSDSANRIIHLPTVCLVYRQDSWKQLAEGDKRLITNMWIHVAVMALQLKAWDGDRQKNNTWLWWIVKSHEWRKKTMWSVLELFFFVEGISFGAHVNIRPHRACKISDKQRYQSIKLYSDRK